MARDISFRYNLQRSRIRASIHRIDQQGVKERTEAVSRRIRRRVYGSPYPHHCWHIDGNHKLIRWGLVVHCGIDGFSRACTFIRCNNNNRATTVLQLFIDACEAFTVPCRVRTDHGGENMLVWKGMLELADDTNPNPVTVGSSVHNQRVERFNRDINDHVRHRFGNLFYSYERSGILDIENSVHIAALHFVYIPRINSILESLKSCHNNHPISSERNRTPLQLIERYRFTDENTRDRAILNSDRSTEAVNIPSDPISVVVEHQDITSIEDENLSNVDVLADDDADGRHIYSQVKEILIESLSA